MADRDKGFSPPTTGGASLLTVFAVLCLTVFALLSLSTVRADSALSEATAKAVYDYYAADGRAQEILARLRFGELPDEVTVEGDLCRYIVPISETQELRVEVEVRGTNDYSVLRWQTVAVGDRKYDDDLNLWDGEEFDDDLGFWDGDSPVGE